MKFWVYSFGLAIPPLAYIGLMYFTEQPIEWTVLGTMAVVILPIFIFRNKIGAIEKNFNAMSDQEKVKAIAKTASDVAKKTAGLD